MQFAEGKMEKRFVDEEIILVPYYPNPDVALAWYQDHDVCKQVDNIDRLVSKEVMKQCGF
jgi:hypothetical protein